MADNLAHLRRTTTVLPVLLDDLTERQFRWKPDRGDWSILEIVGHMLAEETQDFRIRLKLTLEDPEQAWSDYDPEGVVVAEQFNERCPESLLQEFLSERAASIAWLRTLSSANWNQTFQHRRLGPIRAGDLFVSWAAHDKLHLRQIVKRQFELLVDDASPFESSYAGDW